MTFIEFIILIICIIGYKIYKEWLSFRFAQYDLDKLSFDKMILDDCSQNEKMRRALQGKYDKDDEWRQ